MQISHKAQSGQTTGEFMRIMPFYIIILPKIRKKKKPTGNSWVVNAPMHLDRTCDNMVETF